MAINKSTQKLIKTATKNSNTITLNPTVYTVIVTIPNQTFIEAMNKSWENAKKTGKENVIMQGSKDGVSMDPIILPGSEKSAPTKRAFDIVKKEGGKPRFGAHPHPPGFEEENGEIFMTSPFPSRKDVKTAETLNSIDGNFNGGFDQSMVIGPFYGDPTSSNPDLQPSSSCETQISFYRGNNNQIMYQGNENGDKTMMKPNASMNFKKFIKAATKANNNGN